MYMQKGKRKEFLKGENKKMNEKVNEYFEARLEAAMSYEKRVKEHKEELEKIWSDESLSSEESEAKEEAWYKERDELIASRPYSEGDCYAFRAWDNSIEWECEELDVNDMPFKKDIKDFVNALRESGCKEFILTDKSSALMENLHELERQGCKLEGLCTSTRTKKHSYGNETEKREGIRISI